MNKQLFLNPDTTLKDLLLDTLDKFAERPALYVNEKYYSYRALFEMASRLSEDIKSKSSQRCIIFTGRTEIAYAGILACILANKTYVPMNPREKLTRNQAIFALAETDLIITDQVLSPLTLKRDACKRGRGFLNLTNDVYLLFTSGSTGTPKSVCISHKNVLAYIHNFLNRHNPNETDRFSQITELTFDFSVHDIFVCWSVGACLYVLPENGLIGLPKFISTHEISYWASTPSTILLLKQFGKLNPGSFPSIRCSIFCGEILTNHLAHHWHLAAPNSIVDNLYGPTEATVACAGYVWNPEEYRPDNSDEAIPIGKPFPDLAIQIIDSQLMPVKANEIGELCLCGPQVISEYWRNPSMTEKRFIKLAYTENKIWYRTGDLAFQDHNQILHYKGRCDDEIKIRGYRVEKSELEAVLRRIAQTELVAVIISQNGQSIGLIAFISEAENDPVFILKQCRNELPDYMIPSEIIVLKEFPFNPNGKVDYKKLKELKKESDPDT